MSKVIPDKITLQEAFELTITLFKSLQVEHDQLKSEFAIVVKERDMWRKSSNENFAKLDTLLKKIDGNRSRKSLYEELNGQD